MNVVPPLIFHCTSSEGIARKFRRRRMDKIKQLRPITNVRRTAYVVHVATSVENEWARTCPNDSRGLGETPTTQTRYVRRKQ